MYDEAGIVEGLIKEFLKKNNYNSALSAFEKEAADRVSSIYDARC